MSGFRFTIEVEVWRAPARNRFGDTARTLHHTIPGCVLAPRYSNEESGLSSRVITGFSLYGPAGSDILAADRIKDPRTGNFYDVVGEAAEWENPFTGWAPGFEAALERVM